MGIVAVTDNNEFLPDGVTPNPNFGQTTESGQDDPPAKPNTPNNPYFGKQTLTAGAFIGLSIGALGVPAANRLVSDPAFSSIRMWLQSPGVEIDTDDKAGQFLGVVQYLQTTNALDGHPLVNSADMEKIMGAWQ